MSTTNTDLKIVSLNSAGCRALLPHRDVMALIDGVTEYEPSERKLTAFKRVPTSEFSSRGYYPRKPMFPPSMVIEALAQASGLMMNVEKLVELHSIDPMQLDQPEYLAQLPEIPLSVLAESDIKQHTQVYPGDTIHLDTRIALQRKEFRYFKVAARVGETVVASGSLLLSYPAYFEE